MPEKWFVPVTKPDHVFLSLWDWLVGGMWRHLVEQAAEHLECCEHCLWVILLELGRPEGERAQRRLCSGLRWEQTAVHVHRYMYIYERDLVSIMSMH